MAAAAASSTTMIPAWLAGLPPVLAASLVAGAAGVAGALLGGRTARRTAERTADLTRQDEQRRWNRERREKAYVALLDRRNHLIEVRRQWAEGDPDRLGRTLTDIKEFVQEESEAMRLLGEAFATLELVGSTAAVRLARRWVEELRPPTRRPRPVRSQRSVRLLDPSLPRPRPSPDQRLHAEHPERWEALHFRDPFVALIRKELGVDQ
jgi:hypothetical protein